MKILEILFYLKKKFIPQNLEIASVLSHGNLDAYLKLIIEITYFDYKITDSNVF